MLLELRVRELGVIDELHLALGPGLTVVTGETGAGKTLVVEALALLLGGRADPLAVRRGATEAVVEGRFVVPGDEAEETELVLARVVPAEGRARATMNGSMTTTAALSATGDALVDLYGQHTQQSLLRPSAQRAALDRFANADPAPVKALRQELRAAESRLADAGGDAAARRRELELIGFQLDEIASAHVSSADEDERLGEEEAVLAHAATLREAAETGGELLAGGDRTPGALDGLGRAIEVLERHGPLAALAARLRGLAAECADVASDLRRLGEGFEEDPARLEEVRSRRNLLHQLCRKYGPDLAGVLAFADAAARRAEELGAATLDAEALEADRSRIAGALAEAEQALGDVRRAAAPALAAAVESHLGELALERARVVVELSSTGSAEDVELLLAANPGEEAVPLAKAASGGELSRVMLALRLVLSEGPPTMVFDEVDAGLGGATGLAVGRALAELATAHQVLVVTHLAQVAAFADHHVRVTKAEADGRTVTRVEPVDGEARVAELSRMLSGHPNSDAARRHALELLESARRPRVRADRRPSARAGRN